MVPATMSARDMWYKHCAAMLTIDGLKKGFFSEGDIGHGRINTHAYPELIIALVSLALYRITYPALRPSSTKSSTI